MRMLFFIFFFFQAEDGIRDRTVTGVQTCALPIYIVDELGGDDVREQRRGCKALGEERERGRRDLHSLPAARTAVLGPDVPQHPHLRGLVIELLGDLLTDALERRAVLRTDLLVIGEIVNHLDPGQVRREGLAAALLALVGRDQDPLGGRLRGVRERLGLVEEAALIGRRLRGGGLLRGAAEELRLEPAVLFLKELDALLARRQASRD